MQYRILDTLQVSKVMKVYIAMLDYNEIQIWGLMLDDDAT